MKLNKKGSQAKATPPISNIQSITIRRFFKSTEDLPIPDHLQGCALTTHVNPALLLIALN